MAQESQGGRGRACIGTVSPSDSMKCHLRVKSKAWRSSLQISRLPIIGADGIAVKGRRAPSWEGGLRSTVRRSGASSQLAGWGFARRFMDMPRKRSHWRGCDEAWHLQMAIDADRGQPQRYRVHSGDADYGVSSFSRRCQLGLRRRLITFGRAAQAGSCLMAYALPRAALRKTRSGSCSKLSGFRVQKTLNRGRVMHTTQESIEAASPRAKRIHRSDIPYQWAIPHSRSVRRYWTSLALIYQVPYLESTPRYVSGEALSEMAGLPEAALEAYLAIAKEDGDLPQLVYDPPYSHQSDAIRGCLIEGRNLVIMTGTGSGQDGIVSCCRFSGKLAA